jgi:hypothetical protein
MPHTWVGADLINSARSLFVYEDGDTLVLGAGIPRSWYGKGVAVENLPTAFGRISYRLEALPGGKARIRCWGDAKPPGGFRVRTTGKPVSFSKLPATVTVGAREL